VAHQTIPVVSKQNDVPQGTDPRSQQGDDIFRLLVDCVKDYAIFLLDPSGKVVTWNQGAERIKGYRAKEIIGKHFSCFYPREAREANGPTANWKSRAKRGDIQTKACV